MRITVDFDETLDKKSVQEKIKILVQQGFDVWILTTRFPSTQNVNWEEGNRILYQIAAEVGIPVEKIVFTSGEWKHNWLTLNPDVFIHIENYYYEMNLIQRNTKTIPISIHGSSWFNKMKRLLKKI